MIRTPHLQQGSIARHSWLWAGLALLAFSAAGVFPDIWLASLASADHALDDAYVRLLEASQWTLAFALLAGGAGATIGVRISQAWPGHKAKRALALLPLAIPLCGFLGAGLVQWGLFGGIPHITDATSHWFQSRIFSAGHLSAPVPPCLPAFFQHNVIIGSSGQWHTKYLPGQALWLIWPLRHLMMPLGFALFLIGARRIVAHYFDRSTALVATGLLSLSPLMLLLAGSFMSHTTVLMWLCGSWAFLLKAAAPAKPSRTVGWAVASGFCGGMGLLTRPQDALLFGLFMLGVVLPRWWRNPPVRLWIVAGELAGLAPPLGALLFWNQSLYGDILASGYNFSAASAFSQTPIIHDALGFSAAFTWTRALAQSAWVGLRLNQALLGWPAALLLPLPALALPSVRRKNWICLFGAGWLYLPYFFFHYYGFELEARYAAMAAPLLVVMIASLLVAAFRAATRIPGGRRALAAWLAAFFLYAALYYWPVYLLPRYAHGYEEASPDIHRAALAAGLETPALVLLSNEGFGYSSGFIHNDPLLKSPILYARDLPEELPCLRAAFPGRQIYRYQSNVDNRPRGRFLPLVRPGAPPASSP